PIYLVWSIHANAGGGVGRCAFYWGTSKQSKKLAELYVDEVKKAGYSTHGSGLHAGKRGSWTNLHINRETNMPAVLTENGFMDNASDFKLIFGSKQEEYTDKMAKVHVKAIQRFLNKDFKDGDVKPETPKKETPAKKPAKTSKWNEKTGKWTGQTLKQGDSGKPVKQMQQMLADNHYYPKKGAKNNGVDGYYGSNTVDAVKRYQSMHGLTSDGIAGKKTYAKLKGKKASPKKTKTSLPSTVYKAVKPYPQGSGVRKVQKALASVYYYPNKGAKNNGVDGVYGPDTADAVKRYQSTHGLNADGIYGPKTQKSLEKNKK